MRRFTDDSWCEASFENLTICFLVCSVPCFFLLCFGYSLSLTVFNAWIGERGNLVWTANFGKDTSSQRMTWMCSWGTYLKAGNKDQCYVLINTGLKSTWPEHIIAAVGHHWKYIHIAFATRLSFCTPLQHRGSLESSLWHVDIQPTSSIASKCSISTSRCSPEMPSLTPSFLPHTHCIVP